MTAAEEWTRFQCADHWGIKPDTWSGYVTRGQAPAPARHVGRTPVWDADTVRTWNRPGPGARTDLRSPVMASTQDIANQVTITLGDEAGDFDVDAIVEEIGDTYGRDLGSIDDIPDEEYWAIVKRHDTTATT